MKSRAAGFTLIELLVVIAIIAILAAILFPVFISAKASAGLANCQSNIKQMGIAMQLYTESADGRLPRYHNGLQNTQRRLWWDYINPYLKADKIYRCPALPDTKGKNITQYGINSRVYGYGVNHPHIFDYPARSPQLSAIPRASRTLLMCDSYTMGEDLDSAAIIECGYPAVYCRVFKGPTAHNFYYTGQMPDGNMAGRHGGSSKVQPYGKTVVLYCDLHVKSWPKEYVSQQYGSLAESKNSDLWAHFDNIQK